MPIVKNCCSCTLVTTLVVAILFLLFIDLAKSEEHNCISEDMSVWPGYNFLSQEEFGKIQEKMPKICEIMREKDSEGQKIWLWSVKASVLRFGLCDGGHVQSEHSIPADSSFAKDFIKKTNITLANFCKESEKKGRLNRAYSKYLESVDSNMKELFCVVAENIGRPGVEGFRQIVGTVLGLTEAPSLVGLREKAKELCISLKLGEIGIQEALIRLKTEERFATPSIAKETLDIAQDTIWDWLTWPFVILASILGVIATAVGIFKAFYS